MTRDEFKTQLVPYMQGLWPKWETAGPQLDWLWRHVHTYSLFHTKRAADQLFGEDSRLQPKIQSLYVLLRDTAPRLNLPEKRMSERQKFAQVQRDYWIRQGLSRAADWSDDEVLAAHEKRMQALMQRQVGHIDRHFNFFKGCDVGPFGDGQETLPDGPLYPDYRPEGVRQ